MIPSDPKVVMLPSYHLCFKSQSFSLAEESEEVQLKLEACDLSPLLSLVLGHGFLLGSIKCQWADCIGWTMNHGTGNNNSQDCPVFHLLQGRRQKIILQKQRAACYSTVSQQQLKTPPKPVIWVQTGKSCQKLRRIMPPSGQLSHRKERKGWGPSKSGKRLERQTIASKRTQLNSTSASADPAA